MDLSVIIVSWNVADLLMPCLDSLYAAFDSRPETQAEVIVVDSNSEDDTVAMIEMRYPQVKLLKQADNVGFSRGNNIGLEYAQGSYILLLNPDTEIIDDAPRAMMDYLEDHPGVGIVGPHTRHPDGSTQSTRRRFPSLLTAFFESTWLQPYAPATLLERYYVADQADDNVIPVDWVQGSALMLRRAVYDQIGGMDPGYFMFSEELDLCRRAKDAGWGIVYLGNAEIIHHGGRSTDQVVAQRHIYFQESKLRYFRKFHGPIQAQLLRVFLLLSYTFQLAFEATKGLIGHKRALRSERVRQYWQVLRSGLKVS